MKRIIGSHSRRGLVQLFHKTRDENRPNPRWPFETPSAHPHDPGRSFAVVPWCSVWPFLGFGYVVSFCREGIQFAA
jgi:hypothetical protein